MSHLPELMLLGFAAWTLLLLLATVGTYRFNRIFRRQAGFASFPADRVEGDGWYARAMRAHANCIENLPVFAVVVYALRAYGVEYPTGGPAVRGNSGGTRLTVARACELRADRSRGVGALHVLFRAVSVLRRADRDDRVAMNYGR